MGLKIQAFPDAEAVAQRAAEVVAERARQSVAARGAFVWAVSGGSTPWRMLHLLADQDVPWPQVQIVQVDERIAPAGHADRNLTHLKASLLERVPLDAAQIHPMPVEADDLTPAAAQYAATLQKLAGTPPVLDLVHLGLGSDGHTASLVPGDLVLDVTDVDVAMCGEYQGRPRMTLTYPLLNRAREILWLVTGASKTEMLRRLRDGDPTIPAGRICQDHALVLADEAAAAEL